MQIKKLPQYLAFFLLLAILIFSALPPVAFPQDKDKSCISDIEGVGTITSYATLSESGQIYNVGMRLNILPGKESLAYFHSFDVVLEIPPGHLKSKAIKSAFENKLSFFIKYAERSCNRTAFDIVQKVWTPKEDLTELFVNK